MINLCQDSISIFGQSDSIDYCDFHYHSITIIPIYCSTLIIYTCSSKWLSNSLVGGLYRHDREAENEGKRVTNTNIVLPWQLLSYPFFPIWGFRVETKSPSGPKAVMLYTFCSSYGPAD